MSQLSRILIVAFILNLFSISSQNLLRKTLSEDPLSICYPVDPSTSINGGTTIICSEKICHGTIDTNDNFTFTNVTIQCNEKGCATKNKPSEECNVEPECQNCITIILTCFNGYCIGGRPSNNEHQNENNNNGNNNNGGNNNGDNNDNKKSDDTQNDSNGNTNPDNTNNVENKETDKKEENREDNNFPFSNPIIINCQDRFCRLDDIDDNESIDNDGIICKNRKCTFKPKEKEELPSNDKKDKNNDDLYFCLGVIGFWIFCISLNFLLMCLFGLISCQCSICCICTTNFFYLFVFAIVFAPFFLFYILLCLCGKSDWYFKNESCNNNINTFSHIPSRSEKIPLSFSRNRGNPSIINAISETNVEINRKEEIELKETKKQKHIQKHSGFCDIEVIDESYYLINNEEVKRILMLFSSLTLVSKSITIYSFNIAQINLIKKILEKEFTNINIILLDEECSNFVYSDYTIISYISSEISEESKKKYPKIKPKLDSKKYYTEEFTNNILDNYTGKSLYLVCNDEYLRKSNEDLDESIKSSINQAPIGNVATEIKVPIINRKFVSNEYDICFIIDNTGSMGNWINIIKEICHNLFVEITKKFSLYDFYFSSVLYADKPAISTDNNFIISFTKDDNEFKSKLEGCELQNGDDIAEDWVSGFENALYKLNWRNGTKLIFHIADAPAHGKLFNTDKKDDKFLNNVNDKHGEKLLELIKRCSERNIKITGISIDKVCSFSVFQKEYEKVDGPKYEIIEINGEELIKGNDYMNKKMLSIIENSINQNKAESFI